MILREALLTNRLSRLWWVDTRDMIADGLNKGAVARGALQALAATGRWDVIHACESHSHAQVVMAQRAT